MQTLKFSGTALLAFTLACTSCTNNNPTKILNDQKMKTNEVINKIAELPVASAWVSSPLRNHIQLELDAPVAEVWSVVGDPARMPEYSEGLEKVETSMDGKGNCSAFICHFKPVQPGEEQAIHHVTMKWYQPNRGWAAIDNEPNPFGLQQSLTLITFEAKDDKTILNWSMHFNGESHQAVKMNLSSLEQALNHDIAARLIQKFGGRVVESFVDREFKI